MMPLTNSVEENPRIWNLWKDALALVIFAAALHLPFHLGSLYGEEDAARLAVDALTWLKGGLRSVSVSEFRYYTSPGYIWLITVLYRLSDGAMSSVVSWLNTINCVAAVVIVIPIYGLARSLLGRLPAVLGTVLFCMMPVSWHAGLFGFPSLPSYLFVIVALWLYDRHLTGLSAVSPRMDLLLVSLLILGTTLLKADLWLNCVALVGLMLVREGFSWRRLGEIALLGGVPLAATFLVSLCVLRLSPETLDYPLQWRATYATRLFFGAPVQAWGFWKGMGVFSVPLFVVALGWLRIQRRYAWLFLFLSWASVSFAFWVFGPGDSPRHHLTATVPIAFAIAWVLAGLRGKRYIPWVALGALLVANYFILPPTSSIRYPSGRLVESGMLLRERVAQYHRLASEFAAVRAPQKVILGSFTNPYFDAEVLAVADFMRKAQRGRPLGYDEIQFEYVRDGQPYTSASVRVSPEKSPAAARVYQEAGYAVYSMEYDLSNGRALDPAALKSGIGETHRLLRLSGTSR